MKGFFFWLGIALLTIVFGGCMGYLFGPWGLIPAVLGGWVIGDGAAKAF